ncbi:ribonuclease HI [Candidatus Saccharibacteria bacterium]|nr:ribonuclease HI [Candidatus Saccharibacteria bacterium]
MRTLWTDGSASPNPGPGGFAVIENGVPVALGSEVESSNIRMEGCALIAAMEMLAGENGEIVTDSEFWINVLTKWAPGWEVKGWKKRGGEIKNLDLVKKAYMLYKIGNVRLKWTRGHVGTDMNELADEWANKAREGATL